MASTPSQFDVQQTPPPVIPAAKPAKERSLPNLPNESRERELRSRAREVAKSWKRVAAKREDTALLERWRIAKQSLEELLQTLQGLPRDQATILGEGRRIGDYEVLLRVALRDSREAFAERRALECIRKPNGVTVPRALDAMAAYLRAVDYDARESTLAFFLSAVQEDWPLELAEFWMLPAFARLLLLEAAGSIWRTVLLTRGIGSHPNLHELDAVLACLRRCMEFDWKGLLDRLSRTEAILREDPAGAYGQMDTESREYYRQVVAGFAALSSWSEVQIARAAVELAEAPKAGLPERAQKRRSHVGFYLVDNGRKELWNTIGYRPKLFARMRGAILEKPTFFYFFVIGLIALPLLILILAACGHGWLRILGSLLALPLVLECAVGVTNLLSTLLISPRRLPRLDVSKGIPREYATLVVVPTLLTDAEQVRQTVKDLEVRYLANRDPNLHFGLLTDVPDSVEAVDEKDRLVPLGSQLVEDLNRRYAGQGFGGFFHLHRNRVYNPVEGIWMGWERKRGKLLDFNNLLLQKEDKFPIKVGDLSILPAIKYVITLDADTQLPRDSAHALIGALAHPLNRAVIDPVENKVVEGYGILQPRVGISVQSTAKSRLAALCSGDTGFDIYTRAVSDVYQDIFGEAIFAGKGIYEVETFQTVLEHRFPSNAILSHDLIEGEYARTGLVSDIEVTDDYPSHVTAYSRRKHRWVRGDWQIILWLLPRVPNYFGQIVRNPLGLISRWKIIDNLRRSLSEAATFLLLICGWILLPVSAWSWTLGILTVISFPTYGQTLLSALRGGRCFAIAFWKNAAADMGQSYARLLFRLSLLCHQSLVMLDAVMRALIRMSFTRKRLLQWETAAEAEGPRAAQDPVESYLSWQPYLAVLMGIVILAVRPWSMIAALPFLLLWGFSKNICDWLNSPRVPRMAKLPVQEDQVLRRQALMTWRFFREFGTAEENWLIPDIVQETPPQVAHHISPTNLGFLLNARLAAYDLGFLTLSEFASLTEETLRTAERMPKSRGHFYNWYDNQSLEPISPRFVSAVDSGNLVCCLWVLKQGCLEAAREPLIRPALRKGLLDHLNVIENLLSEPGGEGPLPGEIREIRSYADSFLNEGDCHALEKLADKVRSLELQIRDSVFSEHGKWWARELLERIQRIEESVRDFAPWLLPEFAKVCDLLGIENRFLPEGLTLEMLPTAQIGMRTALSKMLLGGKSSDEIRAALILLMSLLAKSVSLSRDLADKLARLAATSHALAQEMDFAVLYDAGKKLLSVGYDEGAPCLRPSHYDLLASEARAAAFVAVAKGEIPQRSWFRLGRDLTSYRDKSVLLSWTGTMFEFLLPFLWMKPYPNTMLERSARVAVQVQRDLGERHSIPWGISESSCSDKSPDGFYLYLGFGVPEVAIQTEHAGKLVISPYSTFLALSVERDAAIANLRRMEEMGLVGTYGFYEACDFRASGTRGSAAGQGEVVRCWMAHHQGMSLVAAANVACDSPMTRRFHMEPMVAATERLLQEKTPRIFVSDLPRLANLAGPELLKGTLSASIEKLGASA